MAVRKFSHWLAIAALTCALAHGVCAKEPTVADVLDDTKETGKPTQEEQSTAGQTTEAADPPAAIRKTEKYGRETPRSSVERFHAAVGDNDFTTAANYLDLRRLPKGMDANKGAIYARQLEIILDRSLWVDVDDLSPDEAGFSDDGLPSYRDLIGTVDFEGGRIDIMLQRVPGDERDQVWKFSNATVAQLPRLYEVYGYGDVGEWLSERLPDFGFAGLRAWQWIMLIGLFAVGYVAAYIATWPAFYVLRRRGFSLGADAARLLANPINLLIAILIAKHWFYVVRPSVEARAIAEADTLLTLVLLWGIFGVVDLVRLYYTSAMAAADSEHVTVLLRPAATAIKIIITIIALMTWVENLGFKATTVVAGLGVGGLAVALAAQKSIENLIGAITLYLSAPVKVGDVCQFGGQTGTVEEINLRATRIRTLNRTVIAVPNSIFAEMNLENISVREKIRYEPHLCLSYSTTAAQIGAILTGIREALAERPEIDQDDQYVRFKNFGERGLDFKSLIYVLTTDYREYLGVAEELNLRILEIVAETGAELAEPLRGLTA